MNKDITSVREALLHEALKDIDALIEKISAVDESLAKRIEQSTKEGAGRAYISTEIRFKTMFQDREEKLMDAGRNAANMIGTQMHGGLTQLVAVNEALERKAWRFIAIQTALAVLGGAIGGALVTKMLGA
ncbi:MAG: hypothetical protein ACRYGK_02745 [Janthinobacterium lividum]